MSKIAAIAPVVALALSVAAAPATTPATVKPLTVANGVTCAKNSDCASNYCHQTPYQRANNKNGKCDQPKPLGNVCYQDNGCVSGLCTASKCSQPNYTSGFPITCTTIDTGSVQYLGDIDTADFYGFDPSQGGIAQPYLNFYPHYSSQNQDGKYNAKTGAIAGKNEPILTTSGPNHGTAYTFGITQCTSNDQSTSPLIPSDDGNTYGQIVLTSGPYAGTCVTASNPATNAQTASFTHAPCDFTDSQTGSDNSGRPSTSSLQMFTFTNLDADTTDPEADLSIPATLAFLPTGFSPSGQAIQQPGQTSYSVWVYGVEETDANGNDYPSMYIVPKYSYDPYSGDARKVGSLAQPAKKALPKNLPTTHGAKDN